MNTREAILKKCRELDGFECHCLSCDRGCAGLTSPGCDTCYRCYVATGDKILGNTRPAIPGNAIAECPTKIRYTEKDDECAKFKPLSMAARIALNRK